ncbi:autophagy-related protein 9A-like [Styela clava]
MSNLETSYRRLDSTEEEDGEGDSPPDGQAFLVHVPDGNKARWHHIEDLDAFFTRVYQYHQNHGFGCMMLQQCFELFQFVFVVGFAAFLVRCVKYDVLFYDKPINETKVTLSDAVYTGHQCSKRIGENALLVIVLFIAAVFWGVRAVKVLYNFFRLTEIRAFYSTALRIKPADLDNITWHEVQRRLMMVQSDQQMCIHKQDLTELDIYNRILRFKNYMIAMVNKEVIPMKYRVPILGESVFLTQGLKFNIELILFWGPWSLFANNYNLKEEYKRRSNREELISRLGNQMWWAGFINLLLSPVIFVWQILYSFFSYAEILRREPGSFGARRWSMYSRLYLRHFNELSHEFQARLNRGYSPSTKYMDSFNSPVLTIVAKNTAFLVGSVLAVLLVLTVWDEDVLRVEHVLTTITLCTIIVTICRSFIPKENAVSCPEQLMKKVLSQIHYVPSSWHGRAHTNEVRNQFAQLFQYRAVYILEEVLSPLITPFLLMFPMRNRAPRMIDFFRNFTVDIAGVGDVCSFAQMDVRRHGDPKWQVTDEPEAPTQPAFIAEGGKIELSLMHFAVTNPKWRPPQQENKFLNDLKTQAHRDALLLSRNDAVQNPLLTSLQSLGSIGLPQASFLHHPGISMMSTLSPQQPTVAMQQQHSTIQESIPPESLTYEESMMTSSFPRQQQTTTESRKQPRKPRLVGGSQHEGSMEESGLGLITSVINGQQGLPVNTTDMQQSTRPSQHAVFGSMIGGDIGGGSVFSQSRGFELTEQSMVELAPVEMGISALYMHELYHNKMVQADRTANWESVADNLRSGSYHSDNSNAGPSSGQYNTPSGQYGASSVDPSRPLLQINQENSRPRTGSQNYNTLNAFGGNQTQQTHFGGYQDPQKSDSTHNHHQQPFMAMGHGNTVPVRTSYSDTAVTHGSQGQRTTGSVLQEVGATENIDLDSDSDEAPQEFHLPVEQDSPRLGDLPSLGAPPNYEDNGNMENSGGYQPPQA